MSKYKEITTVFRNVQSLEKAVKDMGLEPAEVNPFYIRNPETAIFALDTNGPGITRFGWLSFHQDVDSISIGGDDYDLERDVTGKTKKFIAQLSQRYNYHEVTRLAKAKGYTVRTVETTDGTLQLQLSRL